MEVGSYGRVDSIKFVEEQQERKEEGNLSRETLVKGNRQSIDGKGKLIE